MFRILLSLFLFVCQQNKAGAQSKIVVDVSNLRNTKGVCLIGLYDNAKSFSGKGEPVRKVKVSIKEKTATAVLENVPAGTYAIAVVHDANDNNRFDTNFIGIPTEGYGASQNKLPFAAAPKFEENKFSTTPNVTTTINIRLRYLF
jgi:uncharacterized protein (DUF2141 family)